MGDRQRAFLLRPAAQTQGAPIDLAAPKEGIFASPSGICMVKGAPAADLAYAYVNEMLGAEMQGKIAGPTFSLPTNTAVSPPAGMPTQRGLHGLDWAFVADNRDGVGQPLGPRNGDLILRMSGSRCGLPEAALLASGGGG